jgi:hypothetical protein
MPKTPEINSGGINPLSPELPSRGQYYQIPLKRKPELRKFKAGEIVLGSIVNVISLNEVTVQLPSGTYTAEIKGRLRKGDTLFFKVQEIEPALTLKIHAVSIRSGSSELPISEIIRILDIPDSEFHKGIIELEKKFKSIIYRDEILVMENFLLSLNENVFRQKSKREIINSLFFIHESGNRITTELFEQLSPAFCGPQYFFEILKQIESDISKLPKNLASDFKSLFSKLNSDSANANNIINLFSAKDSENQPEQNLYILLKTLDNSKELNPDLGYLKNLSEDLLNVFEAQILWNTYSFHNYYQLLFFMPLILSDGYHIMQIIMIKLGTKQAQYNVKAPAKVHEISSLADLVTITPETLKKLNGILYSKPENINSFIEKNLIEIQSLLQASGIILQSISISTTGGEEVDFYASHSQMQPQKISVVV